MPEPAPDPPLRVVVEALCAGFGGIRTYAEHLLAAWPTVFPDDELVVLVEEGSGVAVPTAYRRVDVPVMRPVALGRPSAQTWAVRRAVRDVEPHAVLATLASTTVLHPGVPTAVVHHDLRHVLRPEQFSRQRRILRRISYGRGFALADSIISVSQRSLDDLHQYRPALRSTPSHVIHLGGDHVLSWPTRQSSEPPGPALAFAHQSNKNSGLVLETWRHAAATRDDLPPLKMLGVSADRRPAMEDEIARAGLTGRVELAPFLDDATFAELFARARLIMFPSDFEGFGLPVVEAMTLGIPIVTGPEPAALEVGGRHGFAAAAWDASALAEQVNLALDSSPERLAAARAYAAGFTWRRTVEQTRWALAQAHRSRPAPARRAPSSR